MIKITNLGFVAALVVSFGLVFTATADAQSRGVGGGLAQTPDDGGSRPERGGDTVAISDDDDARNGGSFSCPPVTDPEAGPICALPLLAKDALCSGRGGGSSTGPDGGFICTVPD
ncbi:hypothetical protein [Rhodophyticola porphyridii]|uniref:hypothetical protein n=1 Tax=Rhodophyticola porphyridii TaxID=1852017 RepID=UPI0035D0AFE8